jgi:hypothetical protein
MLEANKYYETRNGSIAGPMKVSYSSEGEKSYSINSQAYSAHGICIKNPQYDLIKEWTKYTPWAFLSDEDKGKFLLAAYNGEEILQWTSLSQGWFPKDKHSFRRDTIYKMKPPPVYENIYLVNEDSTILRRGRVETIKGVPQYSTLVWENFKEGN